MKGQRLFVRPIEDADHDLVRAFLDREGSPAPVPACGLLGKLVGELVAILEMRVTTGGIEIRDILVAKSLRRKRIGRVMLAELEHIAAKMDRPRLIVAASQDAHAGFLRRVGFEREGSTWVRKVTQSS